MRLPEILRAPRAMTPRRHILITGPPGVGKTTLIRQVAERLSPRAAGFYTLEVRDEGGRRIGFDIVTLEGQRRPLARVSFQTPHRVSRYGVDVHAVEEIAIAALERGLAHQAIAFLIVDEIARMELACPLFAEIVERALASPKRVIATIQQSAHPFIARIRAREDVEMFELTPSTRSHALAHLLERLGLRAPDPA